MTNFDYLKKEPRFAPFADPAVAAEKMINIDTDACAINCRRAMEIAVKWMYSVDKDLVVPYQDKLISLINTEEFHDIVKPDIWQRMDFIRKTGNYAAHNEKKISYEQAELCLQNLFYFMDFIACCYAENYKETKFNPSLLKHQGPVAPVPAKVQDVDIEALIAENKALKEKLTARREKQEKGYAPKPLELSEFATRKIYIDAMLQDAGWIEGKDWANEVQLTGMPNKSENGYADYVLYGDDGRPLAVVEAKKTCAEVSKGRQQAKFYADSLEKQYDQRPVIFLTNGFETHIWNDKYYPERRVAAIYSKRDLEKEFNKLIMHTSLKNIEINKDIAGRYYQEAAIKAVCRDFDEKNRRKALLVMATGSGKTRTVIELVDVLLQHGWVKNVLFLADRDSLITQAKRSFVNLLPDLSITNLCEAKENYNARCVFSTYQTMMNCIDAVHDESGGKLYTCGHFDLVICDEAHRSIYNRYQDIFTYFDALLIGLTATPKKEIDRDTYEIFELEDGVPTYGYDLDQAVRDKYLVDYVSVETKLKFLEQGIAYDDLSEHEKEEYEKCFTDENGEVPPQMDSAALNEWIFNEDTIKKVLNILMTKGLRIDYGENLGKTIIFAKNHKHAEKILEVFNKEYPELKGYVTVIDNYINYAQSAIDEFSDPKKKPQIAISVDMLDTGIDIPELLNLVFFKKVMSVSKFWQMIGRGTRLCPGLIDGKDKEKFYIFDFCGNFEFFRAKKGREVASNFSLQGSVFCLKAQIAYKLQALEYQTDKLISFRKSLVKDIVAKVCELNRDNFAVKQHVKYVDLYSESKNYDILTYENTLQIKSELAPLIFPDKDDVSAVRFDSLLYGIELAYLVGKKYTRARHDLKKKVRAVADIANIPAIQEKSELIDKILNTGYVDSAGINKFEHIREELRDLMKYIPRDGKQTYDTHFEDDILSMEWNDADLENDELKNYKAKAEYYIRQHQNNTVILKLKTNISLTPDDVRQLEKILWSDVGTKKDYEAECGNEPLGEFVRGIVGLDMKAAKEAFAQYLNNANLNERQIYFVNQIIEYVVQNGMMKDLSVLREPPFTDRGSVAEIFTDMSIWNGVLSAINNINKNAKVA